MAKILCEFEGERMECKVFDNMGYQGGNYVKEVEYNGEGRIVIKRGGVWSPKPAIEKFRVKGIICGQGK